MGIVTMMDHEIRMNRACMIPRLNITIVEASLFIGLQVINVKHSQLDGLDHRSNDVDSNPVVTIGEELLYQLALPLF